MSNRKVVVIEEAIVNRQILVIKYDGGSQAGAVREIQPIKINALSLIAECVASQQVKTFLLEKLEILESDISAEASYRIRLPEKESKTLAAALSFYAGELTALGWAFEYAENSAELFSYFKNGKRKRTPDIYIVNLPENTYRSWYLHSKGMRQGKTFGSISSVRDAFLAEARMLAQKDVLRKIG